MPTTPASSAAPALPATGSSSSCILSIDIGTTSVKVALVDCTTRAALIQHSQNTHAACNPMFPPGSDIVVSGRKLHEQDPRQIFSVLIESLKTLTDTTLTTMRCKVAYVAVCSQMHGVMLWNGAAATAAAAHAPFSITEMDPAHLSSQITWLDERCSPSLMARLQQYDPNIHQGYGFATVASIYFDDRNLLLGPDCQYTHAGTIGDFIVSVLLKPSPTSTHLAQSLGFYDAEKHTYNTEILSKVFGSVDAEAIVSLFPRVDDSLQQVLVGETLLAKLCPALFSSSSSENIIRFTPALGDNQCSTLAALNQLHAMSQNESSSQAVINLSTSLQVAVTFARDGVCTVPDVRYELREYFNGQKFAVCASMNGGNVLHRFVSDVSNFMSSVVPGENFQEKLFNYFSGLKFDDVDWDAVPELEFYFEQAFLPERWELRNMTAAGEHEKLLDDPEKADKFFAHLRVLPLTGLFSPAVMFYSLCRELAGNIAALAHNVVAESSTTKASSVVLCGGVFDRFQIVRELTIRQLREKNADIVIHVCEDADNAATACLGAALSVIIN